MVYWNKKFPKILVLWLIFPILRALAPVPKYREKILLYFVFILFIQVVYNNNNDWWTDNTADIMTKCDGKSTQCTCTKIFRDTCTSCSIPLISVQ